MKIELNAYQQADAEQWFREEVLPKMARGEDCGGPFKFVAFPCQVPGMAQVLNRNGHNVHLLYPEPRPVPKDPAFQPPMPVRDTSALRPFIYGHPDAWRDPAWAYGLQMDAPEEMPAGSVLGFSTDFDAYGAEQSVCYREDAC